MKKLLIFIIFSMATKLYSQENLQDVRKEIEDMKKKL